MPAMIDPDSLATQGETLYMQRIKAIVEPAHIGKYLAIEVESGDYFLGSTLVEAAIKARTAYPERHFYFIKIGSPVVRRLGS
ncbi:hypothetical protein [Candidatus Entotheonella palauensis]|uniref:DUF5678 domain-containing protein n=1 Tax=Candidatus Entotheonella gemina TaxID=1429439 RepID=W4LR57_9BACT|nr:hypothetical protein [Candidatus Entotheonella palauensis]ETX00226.1 MAG: hypothetical protein ETSY2_39490 [Candidatus Entotheonella gemina]